MQNFSPDLVSQLNRFLLIAKQATYAAQGDEASVTPLLSDSKQLEYRDGEWFYRDIYVGMFRFVGQEIVYFSNRAVWSMSYAGGLGVDVENAAARPVYAFLRQALREAPLDLPLRGPALLEADGMRYTCQCTGSIERFHGTEIIMQSHDRLYELHFSGGFLS